MPGDLASAKAPLGVGVVLLQPAKLGQRRWLVGVGDIVDVEGGGSQAQVDQDAADEGEPNRSAQPAAERKNCLGRGRSVC